MPPDNAATVAAGAPVLFPQNGPTAGGVVRLNLGAFVLPRAGTYSVDFSVSVTEPGQLAIAIDSGGGMVELSYTVYGRATGTSQIAGDALITTTAASSKVELVIRRGTRRRSRSRRSLGAHILRLLPS